jgi:cell division protein FtsB
LLAARFPILKLGAAQKAALDPEMQKLLAKKEELEQKIDQLKYRKAAMPTSEYRTQLTQLLLELARTQKELDGE